MKRFFTILLTCLLCSTLAAQVEVVVGDTTSTSSSGYFPMGNIYKYSTTQTIYGPKDFNGKSGIISHISYQVATSTTYGSSQVKIYMGHKPFNSGFSSDNYLKSSDLTLVYSGSSTQGWKMGWETYTLTTPFDYNGVDYLVVVVCRSSYKDNISSYSTTMYSDIQTIYCNSDYQDHYASIGSFGNALSKSQSKANTKFTFSSIQDNIISDGAIYGIKNNGLILLDGSSTKGELEIPEKIIYQGHTFNVFGILENAFKDNKNLTKVSIPNSVTVIGQSAFVGCKSEVVLPDSLVMMKHSFSNNLTTIFGDNISRFIIRETATEIGAYAFYGCKSLESISFPNSIKTININAFVNCVSLRFLNFNEGLLSIESDAFNGCSSLESVTIPNSVTKIGNRTFEGCSSLSSAIIGAGVTSIGFNAFPSLVKTIWLPNTPPEGLDYAKGNINYVANNLYTKLINVRVYTYLSSLFEVDGVKYVPISTKTCDVLDCTYDPAVVKINVPVSIEYKNRKLEVQSINDYSFYGNKYIEQATIDEGIPNIGNMAFYNCSSLEGISIPNSVTTLGSKSFYGCSAMKYVNIGNGLTKLQTSAFQECSSLPQIRIPNNILSISDDVFAGCKALKNVYISDRSTALTLGNKDGSSSTKAPLFADCPLDSIYIGGKITYNTTKNYSYSPFWRNTSLRSVMITDKEEEIYQNEFYGCTGLENVAIGDGVKKIGGWAFSGCSSLKYFEFGTGMEGIGEEALSDCVKVTRLISKAVTPPTCGREALADLNFFECTLNVPDQSIEAYGAADQWKNFWAESYQEEVVTPGDANGDGSISISDVVSIANKVLNPAIYVAHRKAFDLDGDGEITIYDLIAVVNKMLGK